MHHVITPLIGLYCIKHMEQTDESKLKKNKNKIRSKMKKKESSKHNFHSRRSTNNQTFLHAWWAHGRWVWRGCYKYERTQDYSI